MTTENISKEILNKWATLIIDDEAIWQNKEGESQVNQDKIRHYAEKGYSGKEVLWVAPKDSLVFEFEDDPKRNERFIAECESSAKSLGWDYCITGHGGKSDYFRVFNIKSLPLGEDNQIAKLLLFDSIAPASAKNMLDRTNLGWTLSPVIEHKHWKAKYNGAIHRIIRGKNPLEHDNTYPKELLDLIKKSKKKNKDIISKIKFTNKWIEDFLLNYCCSHELPKGARHYIIEKNLTAFIIHRPDRLEIKKRYYEAQGRKHDSLRTWELAVLRGDYAEVSGGELANFIKEHNLDYKIAHETATEENIKENSTISEEELKILKNSNLLTLIDDELKKKIIGEEENRKAIFLIACGKWVLNHQIASFNICVNSNSGAGKDYTLKNVLKIFPIEDVVIRSRISPTAFTYWHNSRYEPNWTWEGKICLLSDISNNILNHEVFKLMCSDGNHSTIVINQMAVDIEIKGKPIMLITTASANPNNEMLRRFPIIQLDETKEQTKAIIKAQAEASIQGKSIDYNPLITNVLRRLKPLNVKIPFGKELGDILPDEHIIMRTHFSRFLDYIKASAALYQYQRETDSEGYILATGEDYDNARIVLKATTSNPLMIPITKHQKMLLAECKKLGEFSVKDIEPKVSWLVQSKLYEALATLQEHGFLTSEHKKKLGIDKPVRYYTYMPFEVSEIPKWEEIDCRKKGIRGEGGNGGNRGIRGNSIDIEDKNDLNIIQINENSKKAIPLIPNRGGIAFYRDETGSNSPNSPPILCNEQQFHYNDFCQKCETKLDRQPIEISVFYNTHFKENLKEDVYEQYLAKAKEEQKIMESPSGYIMRL